MSYPSKNSEHKFLTDLKLFTTKMKVPYKPQLELHTPAPLPEHIRQQMDNRFWAARMKYWEQRPIEYRPEELKNVELELESHE